VQVTRRFLDGEGTFAGVVVASLNPEHFTNFYNNLDFGSSASIALVGADGIVRSSGGGDGGFALGQDLKNTGTMRYLADSTSSSFVRTDPNTGEESLVNFRKVRGYPLWVTVSNKLSEIYQGSYYDLRVNILAGLLLTLIMIAAIEQILRTEAKARQKADQLNLTLENMSQGIMLVTKDFEIPIINSRCAELLGLPKEFIKSPPRFDELVAYRAQAPTQGLRIRRLTFRPAAMRPATAAASSRSPSDRCRLAASSRCAAAICLTAASSRPLPTSPNGARPRPMWRGSPRRIR